VTFHQFHIEAGGSTLGGQIPDIFHVRHRFTWTADADLILGKVERLCKRISSLRTLGLFTTRRLLLYVVYCDDGVLYEFSVNRILTVVSPTRKGNILPSPSTRTIVGSFGMNAIFVDVFNEFQSCSVAASVDNYPTHRRRR
jgi:hypothetical protein